MPAPTVVEVKQADLTGSKLREDQLQTTGIAFGPSYQVRVCSLHLKGSLGGRFSERTYQCMIFIQERHSGIFVMAIPLEVSWV